MDKNSHYPVLTFRVAGQEYGLPVADVAQIIEMVTITSLPQMPPAVQGVINLRGRIVPVLDLRLRLGLPFHPYRLRTPIILVEVNGRQWGLVVDSVEAVVDVPAADLEAGPGLLTQPGNAGGPLAVGLARIARRLAPIFNAGAILSPDDHANLLEMAPTEGIGAFQ